MYINKAALNKHNLLKTDSLSFYTAPSPQTYYILEELFL